jgi:magnesium transporter
MSFLSELIGKTVVDAEGEQLGRLADLVAHFPKDMAHPVLTGLVIKNEGGRLLIPAACLAMMTPKIIAINLPVQQLSEYRGQAEDFSLVENILDQQIIDTDGARVVRANDVELVKVNGQWFVSNVDISPAGILRRIGLEKTVQRLAARLKINLPRTSISLDDVELMPHDQSMRLKIPSEKIGSMHPADLAEIISDLHRSEGTQLLEQMDLKTLADTLEEVEPEFQASLVDAMEDEKVADVLEEMAPDEAADLLAELPRERSEDLLKLMNSEEARDVRKLLAYPVESAGGIMTTEYIAIKPNLSANQVINVLREALSEAGTVFNIYVVDDGNCLVGVFSLTDLIMAKPRQPAADFMRRRVVSVQLLDEQDKVAQVIAKYNLLAVPVVDENNVLHGIVTADDALDQIIPTAWKKRLPRMYH